MRDRIPAGGNTEGPSDLGPRLRAIRLRRGIGLRELARRLELSPSSISQIETGKIRPSVRTLYALASEFGVTVDEILFDEVAPPHPPQSARAPVEPGLAVQRAADRPAISLNSGVRWERLMFWGDEDVEFLEATYEPGGASSPENELVRHNGHEFGHVLSGTLRVVVGFDAYVLGPGDTITFPSSTPHRLVNDGPETVRAIWVVRGRRGAEVVPETAAVTTNGAPGRALVVGVTGISGGNVARRLLADGWEVLGVCRTPRDLDERIVPVATNLEDPDGVAAALRGTAPTHVFYATWQRRATEAENCDVNGRMLQNLLDATAPERSVRHVALVTGLKHYLGPFEAYAKVQPDTPFSEEQPRLPYENFYYTQEDVLFAAAERDGFTWSVHRPHTLIGWALGNAMNMGVTLAVYAAICRETGRPFRYPGSREQWEAVTDVTDASLLADHLVWAATTPAAANQALNIVNGDVFRWRRLWPRLAAALGVEPEGFDGGPAPLEEQMADAEEIWPAIVRKHGLRDLPVERLASWWHTDADLGRTIETFTDMGHSRRLGFLGVRDTATSFTALFERLRAERIVP